MFNLLKSIFGTYKPSQEAPRPIEKKNEVEVISLKKDYMVDNKPVWEHAVDSKHDLQAMTKCYQSQLSVMKTGMPPAPYYAERVAIILRKDKRIAEEIKHCEEFISLVESFYKKWGADSRADIRKAPTYKGIVNRLEKAKILLDKQKVKDAA
jgi:hypothetical protein